jgi:hypothetical protein
MGNADVILWQIAAHMHWPQWTVLVFWLLVQIGGVVEGSLLRRIGQPIIGMFSLWLLFKGGFFTGGQ